MTALATSYIYRLKFQVVNIVGTSTTLVPYVKTAPPAPCTRSKGLLLHFFEFLFIISIFWDCTSKIIEALGTRFICLFDKPDQSFHKWKIKTANKFEKAEKKF